MHWRSLAQLSHGWAGSTKTLWSKILLEEKKSFWPKFWKQAGLFHFMQHQLERKPPHSGFFRQIRFFRLLKILIATSLGLKYSSGGSSGRALGCRSIGCGFESFFFQLLLLKTDQSKSLSQTTEHLVHFIGCLSYVLPKDWQVSLIRGNEYSKNGYLLVLYKQRRNIFN